MLDSAQQGDEPVLVRAWTVQNASRKAGQQVLRHCQPGQGGLARSQVSVLGPSASGVTLPTRFGAGPLTQELQEWNAGKGVLITVLKHYKGLEANAVVIIEKSAGTGNNARADANRAPTRAGCLAVASQKPDSPEMPPPRRT